MATEPEIWVRFPALLHFLRSRWSGTGPTQPREDNWGSDLNEKVAAPVYKTEINGRGNMLPWPCNTLYPQRLALTSLTSGGHSVGISSLADYGHGVSLVINFLTFLHSFVAVSCFHLTLNRRQDSSVTVMDDYGLCDQGSIPRKGQEGFLFTCVSRPALGPTWPPFQWVSFPGSKAATHLDLMSKLNSVWNCTSTSHTSSWCGT
jgi:hypothetical protein